LLVGSYFLLNLINPDLINLPVIETEVIGKISDTKGCCLINNKGRMNTETECKNAQGIFDANKVLSSSGTCEDKVCCLQHVNGADRCFETIKDCDSTSVLVKKGSCRGDAKCTSEYTVKCANQGDGTVCATIPNCYCYGGIALTTEGKLFEPCGVKYNSPGVVGLCIKESDACTDENNFGGRSCESGLKCCLDAGIW
jgi:hypothetical protein